MLYVINFRGKLYNIIKMGSFVCVTVIATIILISLKEAKGTHQAICTFKTSNKLTITFSDRETTDGVCRQKTKLEFSQGPAVLENVDTKCVQSYDEEGKTLYDVGAVQCAPNYERAYIVTPQDECKYYHPEGGQVKGPESLSEGECTSIRSKLMPSKETGGKATQGGEKHSQDGGTHSKEGGTHSQEGGTHTQEGGTHTQEGGTHTQEGGTHSQEGGTHSQGEGQPSQEGGNKQEGGDNKTQEGGDNKTQEGGDNKTQEGGDKQEGGDNKTQEGGDKQGDQTS